MTLSVQVVDALLGDTFEVALSPDSRFEELQNFQKNAGQRHGVGRSVFYTTFDAPRSTRINECEKLFSFPVFRDLPVDGPAPYPGPTVEGYMTRDRCEAVSRAAQTIADRAVHQTDALRHAIARLKDKIARDSKVFESFSNSYLQEKNRIHEIFSHFENVWATLKRTNLSPVHQQQSRCATLADLLDVMQLDGETETIRHARYQRRFQMLPSAEQLQLREDINILDRTLEWMSSQSRDLWTLVGSLTELQQTPTNDMAKPEVIEAQIRTLHMAVKKSNDEIYNTLRRTFYTISHISSKMRELDRSRQEIQSLIVPRLLSHCEWLRELGQLPNWYQRCCEEQERRLSLSSKVEEIRKRFEHEIQGLNEAEQAELARFQERCPPAWTHRLFPTLVSPPQFVFTISSSNDSRRETLEQSVSQKPAQEVVPSSPDKDQEREKEREKLLEEKEREWQHEREELLQRLARLESEREEERRTTEKTFAAFQNQLRVSMDNELQANRALNEELVRLNTEVKLLRDDNARLSSLSNEMTQNTTHQEFELFAYQKNFEAYCNYERQIFELMRPLRQHLRSMRVVFDKSDVQLQDLIEGIKELVERFHNAQRINFYPQFSQPNTESSDPGLLIFQREDSSDKFKLLGHCKGEDEQLLRGVLAPDSLHQELKAERPNINYVVGYLIAMEVKENEQSKEKYAELLVEVKQLDDFQIQQT